MVIYENTPEWREAREARFHAETPDSLGDLLTKAATTLGDALAIDFFDRGEQLTFSQWDSRANQVANGLQDMGVCKGMQVAVMLSNVIEFPITWLALARIGAVLVPTNPAYTSVELGHVVDTADVQFIVLEACSISKAEAVDKLSSEKLIVVDEPPPGANYTPWRSLLEGSSTEFTAGQSVQSSDRASIQFTSGTTGMPKGVTQSHQFWLVTAFNTSHIPKDIFTSGTVLGESPFFYFDGLWFLSRTLMSGATLYQADRMSLSKAYDRLATTQAEIGYAPYLDKEPSPRERKHNCKLMLTVGASAELSRSSEQRLGTPVREGYGMTEVGLALTVPYKLDDESMRGTCGVPHPLYEAKVVDEHGQNQPDDTPGELWIRGPGVSDSYWNSPEATHATRVDDWFRTGDIFEKTPLGCFKYVGRFKDMLKRSGENISAHEVENVVMEYPPVQAVAVIPVPHEIRTEEVKAVIQLRDGCDPTSFNYDEFMEFCLASLAKFKVPRYVAFVSEFERTPSDKIIKASLGDEDPCSGCWDYEINRIV